MTYFDSTPTKDTRYGKKRSNLKKRKWMSDIKSKVIQKPKKPNIDSKINSDIKSKTISNDDNVQLQNYLIIESNDKKYNRNMIANPKNYHSRNKTYSPAQKSV